MPDQSLINNWRMAERLDELLTAVSLGRLYVPVGPDVTDVKFSPFGLAAGDPSTFRTYWEFTMPDSSPGRNLLAFANGSLRYDRSGNRLILKNLDPFGQIVRAQYAATCLPAPSWLIYDGVDEALTLAAVDILLDTAGRARRALEAIWGTPVPTFALFKAGTLEIPVAAGDPIRVAAAAADAKRQYRFSVQTSSKTIHRGYSPTRPRILHSWSQSFANLSGHPLENAMNRVRHGLIASGRMR